MLLRRLRFWLGSAKRRRVLQEEMDLHIAEKTAELRERGLSESEARAEARRKFGNMARTAEDVREVWTVVWVDLLLRDFRYAGRALRRRPGFTAAVVLILALGIGANTAIFSIVDRVLLRSLPYADSEQLVMVYESQSGREDRGVVSTANWLDWQKDSRSFESLAAWGAGEFSWQGNLTGDGNAERLNGQYVSDEFFPLLRMGAALGRVFDPENHRPDVPQTVILSHGLWQRRFGGDPGVIGRTIRLEGAPAEIIGVMPPGFQFVWSETDFWAPLRLNRSRDYRTNPGNALNVVGRLRATVTAAAAQTEMSAIARRLAETYPSNNGASVRIVPLREELTGEVKTSLWVLYAAVGVLLLIACSSFAGLLLARSAYQRTEMSVRAALGAGRDAILRERFAESLLLAVTGGFAGVIVARVAVAAMIALVPPDLRQISAVPLDGRVLLYTLGLSVLTGLVFGLAPAITTSRISLVDALRTASRATPHSVRLRQALVVAQIALTVVLLCGSALLARSFHELTRAGLGLDPHDVLTLNVGLDGEPYDSRTEQYVAFYQQAFERLRSLPGVQSVAAAAEVPVTGGMTGETKFHIRGTPEVAVAERPSTDLRMVTSDYFRTLGIPLLRGRDFSANDRRESPTVFIVNQAFADRFLPGSDPLAISISIGSRNPITARIVGIAGNTKERSLRGQAEPTVFFTYSQISTSTDMILFVKADNASTLGRAAVQVIQEIDPNVPVYGVRLLESVFGESIARDRLNAAVSGAFALSALLLAAFGVYGLLSFQVAERTREIGIRMALGGRSSEVARLVLVQSLRLIVPGVALGLAGALGFTQLIESLLYGIPPRDPSTFAGVIALIIGAGAIAAFLPARRATRVDPLTALRQG